MSPMAFARASKADEMLASSRRLATRLGGQLQDDRRAPLTALRAGELRTELEHLEQAWRAAAGDDAEGCLAVFFFYDFFDVHDGFLLIWRMTWSGATA